AEILLHPAVGFFEYCEDFVLAPVRIPTLAEQLFEMKLLEQQEREVAEVGLVIVLLRHGRKSSLNEPSFILWPHCRDESRLPGLRSFCPVGSATCATSEGWTARLAGARWLRPASCARAAVRGARTRRSSSSTPTKCAHCSSRKARSTPTLT